MLKPTKVDLSGERFQVWYRIQGDESIALEKARALCIEQTVEFPFDLLPPGDIPDQIVGQVRSNKALGRDLFEVEITYPLEITGFELTQFLNVLFGNSSLKPGVRVQKIDLPESLLAAFKGPRFGVGGLRELLQVPDRPILCTAIKPMGLSATDMGDLCYQFALGGIDIIKDDHALAHAHTPSGSGPIPLRLFARLLGMARRGEKCNPFSIQGCGEYNRIVLVFFTVGPAG